MINTKVVFKYNDGVGACLCNRCSVVLSYGTSHVDTERYCSDYYNRLLDFIKYVANDYIESSHDKVLVQRNDYIRVAKGLLKE